MPGVLFIVCVPTANFEHCLEYGTPLDEEEEENEEKVKTKTHHQVLLRDAKKPPIKSSQDYFNTAFVNRGYSGEDRLAPIPLEKILDELLKKLEVEHVVWCGDKVGNYYEVFFPVAAGDPCENLLHCLTELGIGVKYNSVVNVVPCSVTYSGLESESEKEEVILRNAEESKRWKNFVESIRSKLTVKQVVEGVRGGGELSFDYLTLIVTADCLAALGLVENNSPNIVAAMLVSPLMGPVMSITFGVIIADRELQKTGFLSLIVGMLISCVFGFIFGLILGSTEMPWGFGDWPTEEMKSRGNVRSLWMGVLWALTSGTGVAVALLQGSAGPLIGVAISASLLPPVVNCGLFWALACIWLLHDGVKIPHIKGEAYHGNTSYEPIYNDYIPIEFAINGIVSACLTVVNVICIFITAIVLLKIKEVAAPYTSSPDLRRFWAHDIKVARDANKRNLKEAEEDERKQYMMEDFKALNTEEMEDKLEQAVKEAVDDDTYRKVKRMSYQGHTTEDITRSLGVNFPSRHNSRPSSTSTTYRNAISNLSSTTASDLAALDKLINSLVGSGHRDSPLLPRRPLSRTFRSHRGSLLSNASSMALPTIVEGSNRNRNSSWCGARDNRESDPFLNPNNLVRHNRL